MICLFRSFKDVSDRRHDAPLEPDSVTKFSKMIFAVENIIILPLISTLEYSNILGTNDNYWFFCFAFIHSFFLFFFFLLVNFCEWILCVNRRAMPCLREPSFSHYHVLFAFKIILLLFIQFLYLGVSYVSSLSLLLTVYVPQYCFISGSTSYCVWLMTKVIIRMYK